MSVIAQYDPKKEKLDNTIKLVDIGYYEADNGRVKSEFYEVGNEVVFINKGRRISWKPENMKYLDEFGTEDVIYSVQDVPLEVKVNYARFNRSMPDVDDWFIQENDRLKHQITIQSFQREPMPWLFGNIEFIIGGKLTFDSDLKVFANGIEQTGDFETDGDIHLYDGDTLIFTLPEVVAFDSAYDRSMVFGKYRVTQDTAGELSFDIVLPNDWISSLDRVYPIVIDPTVVVNSGYSTEGNGGRKLVRLSNGWLVASLKDSLTLRLYKSEDNGATWSSFVTVGPFSTSFTDHAITTDGTYIYSIVTVNGQQVQCLVIDNNGNVLQNATVDTSQFALGNCSLAINEVGTELHAAWASKNLSYRNSFNIRYAKGTINTDGSVTWGAVTQISFENTTGVDCKDFSIVVNANGYPVIFYSYDYHSGTNYIFSVTWNGTSFNTRVAVFSISTYAQNSPSAIFVPQSVNGLPNGLIGVAWHGRDATDQTTDYIRFSKSTDLGANWSAMQKLVPGKNASLTANKKGKLYITYEDPADGKIKRIESTDNGDSWSSPYEVDTGTNPSMMFDHTFTSSLVGWVYMSDSSVKFDKIVLNQPPNAPILDTKSNFDATDNAVFSWTYSDPDPSDNQSAYQLQIIDVATGTTVYDTGKVASATSSHTLPAGTLTNNKQFQWRVKTWDNSDTEGAWSDYQSFYTSAKPSVTITNPSDSATVTESSITVQWSFSDPESEGQSAYQVELLDNADTVIEDTGKVSSTSARSKTLSTTLQNNTTYKVRVTVWDAKGVASLSVTHTFSVEYTPTATPIVTTTKGTGFITLTITNPTPQGSEPNVIYNSVYRRKQGETTWQRIATNIAENGSFNDYTPASGQVYEYYVRAHGDNGTTSDSSVVNESITLTGVWLHDTTDPSTLHQFKYDGDGRSENWQPTAAMIQFAGRKLPIAEYDDSETRSITVNLKMRKYDTDKEMLEKLIRSKNTLCYRDGKGRKMFCHALQLPINDEVYGNTVSLTFEEVSYTEEV